MRQLFYSIIIVFLLGCNGQQAKKTVFEDKPLNIIVGIDFDINCIAHDSRFHRDTIILSHVLNYFKEIQKSKFFKSTDKITITSFNSQNHDNTFTLNMKNLQEMNGGGFYGLEEQFEKLKNSISKSYLENRKRNISSDFYRFFRDDVFHYIDKSYTNKLIIISNGTSIIKEKELISANKTFIPKSAYLNLIADKDWETSGLLQNIELSPVYVENFANLEILMPDIYPIESKDYLNESNLLKTIWESWFNKMGFNNYVLIGTKDISIYKSIVDEFLNKKLPVDFIQSKNRTNEYINFINLQNKELLRGYVGDYYLVDIRSAKTNHLITFNPGKYYIDSFQDEFDKPILEFKSNIVEILNNSSFAFSDYKIFVKGSADLSGNLTFKAKLKREYPFSEIVFYEKLNNSEYRYIDKQGKTLITDFFTNNELPNLRAAFIKNVFQDKYQFGDFFGKIGVLDGSISQDTTFADRNVKIFLYITQISK